MLDSQRVKAPFAEQRGCNGAKKIMGRKRHVAVDTDGRLLMVGLTTVDVFDITGAYDLTRLMDKAAYLDFVVEIVRRSDKQAGFEVILRRWVWSARSAV